jgi:molybdopterin synthase catalytic subunit
MTDTFEITASPIEPSELKERLEAHGAGACVCFEGWIRNESEGHAVVALEYEAHAPLAVKEGERILAEARRSFEILAVACRHRVGRLEVGECAVWVGVTAAHRGAALDACRYVIDEVKHRLPIWKKEHYGNGDSGWVNCVRPSARSGAALARSS